MREIYGGYDNAGNRDSSGRPDSGDGAMGSGGWVSSWRPDHSVYDDEESDAAIEARLDEAGLPTRAESRAAARRLDTDDEDDDAEYDFSPESNAAIEARLDEAGLPTRAEARAAARKLDTDDEDDEDDFGPELDAAAIEARLDEADLPTRAESHIAAMRPDSDSDDEDDFGPESDDTTIEASPHRAERARPDAPAGRTADDGAAPEHEPDWMDRTERQSNLIVTRPYDQLEGLTRPEPQHQRDVEDGTPRGPDGRPERFPEPRSGWVPLINDGGREADPLRGNNCLDCSLSFISTWHGEPQVSAPRYPDRLPDGTLDKVSGERHGMERAQLWLGHQFEYLGTAMDGFHAIEEKLHAGGHGAAAEIVNTWKGGDAHAWNAVNYQGEIFWIDSQNGAVDSEPVHPSELIDRIWAIVIDRKGEPL